MSAAAPVGARPCARNSTSVCWSTRPHEVAGQPRLDLTGITQLDQARYVMYVMLCYVDVASSLGAGQGTREPSVGPLTDRLPGVCCWGSGRGLGVLPQAKLSLLPLATTRRARGVLPPRPLPRRRPLAVRLAERDARAQPAASRLQLAGALRLPLDVEVARVGGNSRLRHSTSHGWHARCGSLYRFDYRRLSAPACGSSGHPEPSRRICIDASVLAYIKSETS